MISSRSTKPKLKKNPKLSFKTQVVLWRKRSICKDILNRSKEIGLQYTDLLGDGGFSEC